MRSLPISAALILGFTSLANGQPVLPLPVAESDLGNAPYAYNGRLTAGGVTGSASLVARGIIATSAGVVYDDSAPGWVPIGDILFEPRYHKGGVAGVQPVAFLRWASYSDRVDNDTESPPGYELPDTHNVNVAVAYFSAANNDPLLALHPEVHVDPEGTTTILRDDKDKTTIGYPYEQPDVPAADVGLMHQTAPGNFSSPWEGLEGVGEIDSEGFWLTVNTLLDVTIFDGAQGGPVYMRDDAGNWITSAIVVGKSAGNEMLVRTIDEKAWNLIEEAINLRQVETNFQVKDLSIVQTDRTLVELAWSDLSTGEAGYKVYRRDTGPWVEIATLPANTAGFTDTGLLTGHVYGYRVQPYADDGNRPPKSFAVQASTRGTHSVAASYLDQPLLQFSNAGESNWYLSSPDQFRSGKTLPNGTSSLRLDIIGPGTVDFEWNIFSIVDPNFPGLHTSNLQVYVNGVPDASRKISGITAPAADQLVIPEGAHQIEWRYTKGPYTATDADAGSIRSLLWTPDPVEPYPILGGYAFPGSLYHGSEWFGVYYTEFWPWVAHVELGWMYFAGTPDGQLYGHSILSTLGDFYTRPDLFPNFFLPDTATWIYYYPGTSSWGNGGIFYNWNTGAFIELP